MRERGVLIVNWIESQTRMLKNVKNMPFYKAQFCNCPIETIDGYDKRSMMDRLRKYRDRQIADGGPRYIARYAL